MDQLQQQIEQRIGALDPAIDLIAVERPGNELLRIYIDHPEGVTLELCERVTGQLRDLLADYSLEVSSPGLDRPLTKPEHYERFVGHTVRVRTSEPIDGRRNFTGRLDGAAADAISLDLDGERAEIPLDRVHRSNLVPEMSEVQS
jgi:ribosome maturation factor RimP